MTIKKLSSKESIELYRLRQRLKKAVEKGESTEEDHQALIQLRRLARKRGNLLLEYHSWMLRLASDID